MRGVRLLAAAAWAAAATAGAVEVREAHYVMGTVLEITVEAAAVEDGRRAIHGAVAEARRLDHELTTFDSSSDLSRLNREAGNGFQRVPPDLYSVLERSRELTRETSGSFDVTVAPLLALWRQAVASGRWPASSTIATARDQVGAAAIALRAPDEARLAQAGMAIDLGGIGKGYAADRMAAVLRAGGVAAALVNFGESSLVAFGAPPGRHGWPVWVRRGGGLDGPLLLRDTALSTSRSLLRGGRVGARRIGDIIDPRTGLPVMIERQATVIAGDAASAEAWSKAVVVDGDAALSALTGRPERGALLLEGSRRRMIGRFASLTGSSP